VGIAIDDVERWNCTHIAAFELSRRRVMENRMHTTECGDDNYMMVLFLM